MMTEIFKLQTTGKITDEFATKKDRKKAYQIFFLSAVGSLVLTIGLYFIASFL